MQFMFFTWKSFEETELSIECVLKKLLAEIRQKIRLKLKKISQLTGKNFCFIFYVLFIF